MRGIRCDWAGKVMRKKIEKIMDKYGEGFIIEDYVELIEPGEGKDTRIYLDGGFTREEMLCMAEVMELVNGGKK